LPLYTQRSPTFIVGAAAAGPSLPPGDTAGTVHPAKTANVMHAASPVR